MEINVESMVDTQRLVLMSHGEVFIYHIQKHLDNISGLNASIQEVVEPVKFRKITEGKVGCKICGRTVQEIYNTEREDYFKFMNEKYGEE